MPQTFLTETALRRNGWRTVTVGWFVSAPHDLSGARITAARDLGAHNGLLAETRDHQDALATVRWASMAAGAALVAPVAVRVRSSTAASARIVPTVIASTPSAPPRPGEP